MESLAIVTERERDIYIYVYIEGEREIYIYIVHYSSIISHQVFKLRFFNRSRDHRDPGSSVSAFEANRIGVPSLGSLAPSHLCSEGAGSVKDSDVTPLGHLRHQLWL